MVPWFPISPIFFKKFHSYFRSRNFKKLTLTGLRFVGQGKFDFSLWWLNPSTMRVKLWYRAFIAFFVPPIWGDLTMPNEAVFLESQGHLRVDPHFWVLSGFNFTLGGWVLLLDFLQVSRAHSNSFGKFWNLWTFPRKLFTTFSISSKKFIARGLFFNPWLSDYPIHNCFSTNLLPVHEQYQLTCCKSG